LFYWGRSDFFAFARIVSMPPLERVTLTPFCGGGDSLASFNADPAELARFSDLAHRWWDPRAEMRPLHEMNPLRLSWIERHLGLAGKDVLDVGCGGGILAEAMAGTGARVTGIDLSEQALKVATLHLHESGMDVRYELASAEDYAQAHAAQFDAVTCMELLEHVPDPASTVAACARLAKPGGRVFFSTINRNPKAYLYAVIGAEYVLGLLPKGTHDYARFIKPSELARWCRAAGLSAVELVGKSYNPLTQRYALSSDCAVNYFACWARDD
jgi:2-polyprenyl-6-hydroxyphenyl methylase/3-demethylubiquinone-9 3-methyltransferase